jgi:soluble epoxide hydrolase / lipid-phosphate phosphatase
VLNDPQEAPKVPPNSLRLYSTKRAADDIKELVKQLGEEKIVLGGHDWFVVRSQHSTVANSPRGGMVVWRSIYWHPEIISHIFSVCTAYSAPSEKYLSVEDLVKGPIPQFGYQLHLASGEVEEKVQSKNDIRQFLNGMYGGRGPDRQVIFNTFTGILFDNIPIVRNSPLMSQSVWNAETLRGF